MGMAGIKMFAGGWLLFRLENRMKNSQIINPFFSITPR
jgi:hypothetical protein